MRKRFSSRRAFRWRPHFFSPILCSNRYLVVQPLSFRFTIPAKSIVSPTMAPAVDIPNFSMSDPIALSPMATNGEDADGKEIFRIVFEGHLTPPTRSISKRLPSLSLQPRSSKRPCTSRSRQTAYHTLVNSVTPVRKRSKQGARDDSDIISAALANIRKSEFILVSPDEIHEKRRLPSSIKTLALRRPRAVSLASSCDLDSDMNFPAVDPIAETPVCELEFPSTMASVFVPTARGRTFSSFVKDDTSTKHLSLLFLPVENDSESKDGNSCEALGGGYGVALSKLKPKPVARQLF